MWPYQPVRLAFPSLRSCLSEWQMPPLHFKEWWPKYWKVFSWANPVLGEISEAGRCFKLNRCKFNHYRVQLLTRRVEQGVSDDTEKARAMKYALVHHSHKGKRIFLRLVWELFSNLQSPVSCLPACTCCWDCHFIVCSWVMLWQNEYKVVRL